MKQESSYFGTALLGLIAVCFVILGLRTLFNSVIDSSYNTHTGSVKDIIKPIGEIYTKTTIDTAPSIQKIAKKEEVRSGKEIYNTFCTVCHANGIAQAPKFNNKADWEPRLKQGINNLLKTSKMGKGAMPPKGTCGDCNDTELEKTIRYMTSKLK